jgi:hypothetical protein
MNNGESDTGSWLEARTRSFPFMKSLWFFSKADRRES